MVIDVHAVDLAVNCIVNVQGEGHHHPKVGIIEEEVTIDTVTREVGNQEAHREQDTIHPGTEMKNVMCHIHTHSSNSERCRERRRSHYSRERSRNCSKDRSRRRSPPTDYPQKSNP